MKKTKHSYERVRKYIGDQDFKALRKLLKNMTSGDILAVLAECDEKEQLVLFRLLETTRAAEVFDLLEPAVQRDLIQFFPREEALKLIGELDPDDQVRLFDELPEQRAQEYLEHIPSDQRSAAAKLMEFEDGTVGRIMSPVRVMVTSGMTVEQAVEQFRKRRHDLDVPVHTMYVTTKEMELIGSVPLSTVMLCEPGTLIDDLIAEEQYDAVHTWEDQEDAARKLQSLDIVDLPVLDGEGRLAGILTSDDAMDVLREEVTDDMYDKVGLIDHPKLESDRSYRLLHGNFFHVMVVRLPFLFITLAGGMAAGAVIGVFEDLLEAFAATAIFIPVIMDMGGNVGTQSSTIFTRGLVLGQISMHRFFRQWMKELANGAGIGIILGIIGGTVAGFWMNIPELGIAVGVSLALTITLAVGLGFLVPWFLVKLGFDQAAGADPIITTIKDISGLMIYFFLVSLLLPQVL